MAEQSGQLTDQKFGPDDLHGGSVSLHVRKSGWVVLCSAIPAVLFYAYLHYSETGAFPSPGKYPGGILAAVAIGVIIGSALHIFNTFLDRWIGWKRYFSLRFLAGYVTNVAITLLVIPLALAVLHFSRSPVFWEDLKPNDPDLIWKIVILLLAFNFIYNVIYSLLYAYRHYAYTQVQHLRNERRQLELQFEALKSQISPHYLFNSLNTISSLLFRDLQSAEQFIRRLAQTYQYILSTQNRKFVLLREELEFVQSYYYLLRIRFQQHLNLEVNVPGSILDTKIPPLALQMLVENAVKHNSLSGDKKLFIYISSRDNRYVEVVNTTTDRTPQAESFKVGLKNIQQRYRYFTDEEVLIQSADSFVVLLPVIHAHRDAIQYKDSA